MAIEFPIANTKQQRLDQHSFAVGYVAREICKRFYGKNQNYGATIKATFVAGAYHDLGKLDTPFQQWVTAPRNKTFVSTDGQHINTGTFSFDKHPTHNEVSVLLYQLIDDRSLKALNTPLKHTIKHVIHWHHAKPFRNSKVEFSKYGDIYRKVDDVDRLIDDTLQLIKAIVSLEKSYMVSDNSLLTNTFLEQVDHVDYAYELDGLDLPAYKTYRRDGPKLEQYREASKNNSTANIIRSCVISADRWVSSLTANQLDEHILQRTLDEFVQRKLNQSSANPKALRSQIDSCLQRFPESDRTTKQAQIAQELVRDNKYLKVLAGAAGCGKTKIALEWASLTNAQKIIWICPRVQICQGIFSELRAGSDNTYLPDTNIELLTGEYKCTNSYENPTPEDSYCNGDIVITTIDQILGAIVSHNNADRLLDYLSSHVVFDEYHEYIQIPAFNLLLAELVNCKKDLDSGPNALLVSATPYYTYLQHILDIDEQDVVEMPSFNTSQYKIEFSTLPDGVTDDTSPLYAPHEKSTFVISNTAKTAQTAYLKNYLDENVILFHSRFKRSDKAQLFSQVLECFKSGGNGEYEVLRSGPIVQASLNISCFHMVSELTTAENTLQRLGRLDRFGTNTKTNTLVIAVPEHIQAGKDKGPNARFLASMHSLASTKAWYQHLRNALADDVIFTLPELYQIYREFYKDSTAQIALESDLLLSVQNSANTIASKLSEPKYIATSQKNSDTEIRLSKSSLRGDSRFVQLALCTVEPGLQFIYHDDYAYDIDTADHYDSLTEACERIEGYGDSNKNLLSYMQRKHHTIVGGKKAYKDYLLLDKARFPQYPVYLSYTPSDLKKVGGEQARHTHAYYYVVCDKQAVGVVSGTDILQLGVISWKK